jgi:hypothetical protein
MVGAGPANLGSAPIPFAQPLLGKERLSESVPRKSAALEPLVLLLVSRPGGRAFARLHRANRVPTWKAHTIVHSALRHARFTAETVWSIL